MHVWKTTAYIEICDVDMGFQIGIYVLIIHICVHIKYSNVRRKARRAKQYEVTYCSTYLLQLSEKSI
jgi:hypothetical protein